MIGSIYIEIKNVPASMRPKLCVCSILDLKLAMESMCFGRLFHSIVLEMKKKCRCESTEGWGIWSLSLRCFITLSTGMRSSLRISMAPAFALVMVMSLDLALRYERG